MGQAGPDPSRARWLPRGRRGRVVVVVALALCVVGAVLFMTLHGAAKAEGRLSVAPASTKLHPKLKLPAPTTTTTSLPTPSTTTTTTTIVPRPAPTTAPPAPLAPSAAPGATSSTPTPPRATTSAGVSRLIVTATVHGLVPAPGWTWQIAPLSTPTFCVGASGPRLAGIPGAGCTHWSTATPPTTKFHAPVSIAVVGGEIGNGVAGTFLEAHQTVTVDEPLPTWWNQIAAQSAGIEWQSVTAVSDCLFRAAYGRSDLDSGGWHCPPGLAAMAAAGVRQLPAASPTTPTTPPAASPMPASSTLRPSVAG